MMNQTAETLLLLLLGFICLLADANVSLANAEDYGENGDGKSGPDRRLFKGNGRIRLS